MAEGGRPRIYDSAEELQEAVQAYFDDNQGNFTITGLALNLGFESRQSFYDYEKDGRFSYTIKKARLTVEAFYESKLLTNNSTGAIFALKNFGWKDKVETEHSGEMGITWHEQKTYEAKQETDPGT